MGAGPGRTPAGNREARRNAAGGLIGSSLQAEVLLSFPAGEDSLLSAADWADNLIVSAVRFAVAETATAETLAASGEKCARCWRVLPEVNADTKLCLRCTDAVASGLVAQAVKPA